MEDTDEKEPKLFKINLNKQLVREQEKKSRLKGVDAQRANILAARTIANVLRTSLGPKGMDKVSFPKTS